MHLLVLLLVCLLAAVQTQHVPLKVALTSDWVDTADPLASCNDSVVAATVDALVVPDTSAAATVLVSLQLNDVQLPGAVVFSAAGYTLALQEPGEEGDWGGYLAGITGCVSQHAPAAVR